MCLGVLLVGFFSGCSRLTIERTYDDAGIKLEKVRTYGFFVNRVNQLDIDRSKDIIGNADKDSLKSMINEDASPGNEALKSFIEIFKLGMMAAGKP